jgi:hypothetical protein
MTQPSDSTMMILGEVRGQLREIIHNMNNQALKNDAVAAQLAKLEGVPAQLKAMEERLTNLETDKHRRDGAMGFGLQILKSPIVGWLAGFGFAAWAYLSGKLG